MIHTYIPYSTTDNITDLGTAYNNIMKYISTDDWVCFLDHDAMFTTTNWYLQLNEIIKNTNYGLLTCMTNRIGNADQKFNVIDENNHDISYHRMIGKQCQEQFNLNITPARNTAPNLISGVLMLLSKKTWETVGGFQPGFLGVDNCMHESCLEHNINVGIMNGVYVYHWYRGDGNTEHINIANSMNVNPWLKKHNK
jgi:glycosyltransferase involved in cell wall biosynthesis